MSNFIKWNGDAEDGRNAADQNDKSTWYGDGSDQPKTFKWNWGEVPFTWDDVQLLIEAMGFGGHGGKTRSERQGKLDNWLDDEPDKKKRLIKLIATVGGKDYIQTRQVEEVQVKVEDVELLIKQVFSRIIVEKKDV